MRTATRLQAGFTLAILMLSLNLLVPLFGERWIDATHMRYEQEERLLANSQQLLAALTDGETGQRGFVITGRDDFLSPLYLGFSEVDRLLLVLEQSATEDAELKQHLDRLKPVIAEQRSYLQGTVDVRRQAGIEAAVARVSTGKGKQLMDTLRTFSGEMQADLNVRLQILEQRRGWQRRVMIGGMVATGLLDLLLIGLLNYFTFRTLRDGRTARHSLRNLSEQLSSGMQRLELRNREISLLSRMAGALHSINSFDECYGIIGRFAGQLFPQNAGSLTLYHPSRDVLESVAHWGDWPQDMDLFEPHSCWAIRRGQSHQVQDPGKDLLCPHLHGTALAEQGYLCVPLMAQGEPLGVLTLGGNKAADLELAEAFAEQVSLGVSNLSLRESLRQQSLVDALTGLHNRRFLDETLRRELLRASRKQSPVAVVLLDVDHFKRFNDTFGHEAGDLVLRHLAMEMKRSVRTSDLACRYGGEEFCLVMPEISREDAIERCESLRLAVSRLQVRYGGQPLGPINISLGLAWFPLDGEQMDALLHAADLALYQAKRGGRNRLCIYRREMDGAEEAPSS
ncbi:MULTISPECIES: diguanylate cyclase [unclassified Pseudomonas]|uniref:diguanylate cyclase n=1 Tax=unclassified Pseudomonas TaxID=196821 RepID=UPI00244A90A9|nr:MULTISPECIES: diguanylate cyclase [unclassified Pseudomonas]MDG9922693.1 diguanylate cyclase [Pseudomonas sp. GD04045]MDH0033174.1 diguanylate cyclase [Pseudomonas sp. GD04019]